MNDSRLTLIHLVSEQTLQNLLPIAAFRPDRVVQVHSRGRHVDRLRGIRAAVGILAEERRDYRDYAPHFVDHELGEENPTPDGVRAELASWFKQPRNVLLNYTGGTKMMSAGAFQLALERGVRAVYCDTSTRRFVWTPEKGAPSGQDFDTLAGLLTVRLLAAAHGRTDEDIRTVEPSADLIAFGREAWAFKRNPSPALRKYLEKLRTHFRGSRNRIPTGRRELDHILRRPFPDPPDHVVRDYLRAACRAGLLFEVGAGRFFPAATGQSKDRLRREIEQLSNLLEGAWLELFVVDRLRANPRMGDVKWSLQPRSPQRQPLGETDVVCVDRGRLALRVVSCKESLRGRSPLEHMEALVQRARTLGGLMARPTLAALHADEDEERRYRAWARALGIDLLVGDEIASAASEPGSLNSELRTRNVKERQ